MSGYTKANLREDVDDQAPKFGMPAEMQARFARTPLGGKTLGLSLFKLAPSFRIPFGHKHAEQEEVYVVVRGTAPQSAFSAPTTELTVQSDTAVAVSWTERTGGATSGSGTRSAERLSRSISRSTNCASSRSS